MKYTTYEQAKWLKEKGYEIATDEVLFCRDEINNIEEHQIKNRDVIYNGGTFYVVDEDEYRVYEQHQVVDWLLEEHGIWVSVSQVQQQDTFTWEVVQSNKEKWYSIDWCGDDFGSPKDAYSSAFDYIRENVLL